MLFCHVQPIEIVSTIPECIVQLHNLKFKYNLFDITTSSVYINA